jgi:hypothetical protein
MLSKGFKNLSLFMVLTVLLLACGGGGEQPLTQEKVEEKAVEKTEKKEGMTPAEVGQKIGELYVQALSGVTELLKDKPAVSEIRPKVEEMKENYVMKLVDLGRKREKLDASGRASVDSQIRLKVNAVYNKPWYANYNEIQQHYFQDRDFHKLVVSFNIIGQYANFDLLKKQEPKEAQRLGIE